VKIKCSHCLEWVDCLPKNAALFVDVRENKEVAKGALPGAICVPLSELEQRFGELPTDQILLLFCGSGQRSQKAQELLVLKGLTGARAVVEGGYENLKSQWENQMSQAFVRETDKSLEGGAVSKLVFERFVDPLTSTYTYLIGDSVSKDAALIDTVQDQSSRYIERIFALGLNLKYLFETHIHADHVTASQELLKVFPTAQIAVSHNANVACSSIRLRDKDVLYLGGVPVVTFETPGHTSESICFWVNEDRIFTGDTLFIDSCGRTDFQAGSSQQLFESLKRLMAFDSETKVFPGHDYQGQLESTIGLQKQSNPLVNLSKDEFVSELASWNLVPPAKLASCVKANLLCGAIGEVP
jgi:sulfur dioxygenase